MYNISFYWAKRITDILNTMFKKQYFWNIALNTLVFWKHCLRITQNCVFHELFLEHRSHTITLLYDEMQILYTSVSCPRLKIQSITNFSPEFTQLYCYMTKFRKLKILINFTPAYNVLYKTFLEIWFVLNMAYLDA